MDKTMSIRQLVPRSFSFDGYDLVGCKARDRPKPFWGDNTIPMGDYTLTVRRDDMDSVSLLFQSVCNHGKIFFSQYVLTFDEFVNKLTHAAETGSDYISFEIMPIRAKTFLCKDCLDETIDCERMRDSSTKAVMAAVSFDIGDIRRALADYHQIFGASNQTNYNNKNGGKNMKNKFFGMNFKFGPNKDPNLASTLLGIAVRDPATGTWYTYDPVNRCHKNLAKFKMGSLPIYFMPITKNQIVPGTLIERNERYVWVDEITPSGNFKVIDALSGDIREILPTESLVPGLNFYTKVVAMDMNSLTDPTGNSAAGNMLSAILMMQWAKNDGSEKGRADFSLDEDIDSDSFNGMGAFLPLIMAKEGIDKNTMIMWMMMGQSDSDDDGMMQMLLLSQLMNGGGNTGLEGIFPGLSAPQKTAAQAAGVAMGNEVICDACGASYPAGTNFCPKCGGKTHPVGVYCKKCGAQLMPGAAFCHKCGTKVGPATCPNCGNEVPEDAAFCPKCGKNLNPVPVTTTVPVAPTTPDVPAPMPTVPAE